MLIINRIRARLLSKINISYRVEFNCDFNQEFKSKSFKLDEWDSFLFISNLKS